MKKKKNSTLENLNYRLHWAAAFDDDIKRVKFILKKGANIKACVYDYNTLHWAIRNWNDEVAVFLIENGGLNAADVNLEDADGKTALYYAAIKGNDVIVELLLACGADESTVPDKPKEQPWEEFLEGRRELHAAVIAQILGKER